MSTARQRKIRMGMVGGGQGAFIGAVHRMATALDGQIELVAGCFSRDPANTRETGQQLFLDHARCYVDYETMAAAEAALPPEKRIDFVSIVTPTVSHFAIAQEFLKAGFHVVCDKPLAYSLDEAKTLTLLVERTGLVFGLTQNYTGYPMVRHARHLVRSGGIGTIRKVIVEYLQDFLAVPVEKTGNKQALWRLDPAQVGLAGTLGEAGIHGFHLLEYITGDPITALCADRKTFLPDRTLEEDANCLLRFQGGGRGVLTVSQIATGEENNLNIRIYGSEGALHWRQEEPNRLELAHFGEPHQILTRGHAEYLSKDATAATRIPSGHPEGYLEAFATLYDGVVEAIRCYSDGKPLSPDDYMFPTVFDGRRGMQLVAKAVESCDNGSSWVETLDRIERR